MKDLVIFEKVEDGTIWARVPDLSGCYSCGDNLEQAHANIIEAIELYLETAREEGIAIPPANHFQAELVKVA